MKHPYVTVRRSFESVFCYFKFFFDKILADIDDAPETHAPMSQAENRIIVLNDRNENVSQLAVEEPFSSDGKHILKKI